MENNEQSENSSIKRPLPKKGFLDNLAKKADELKDKSIELGKMAAREAGELGEKIEHQKIMNELMSADMSDPAIQQKIKGQVEKYQKFTDELMKQINAQTNR